MEGESIEIGIDDTHFLMESSPSSRRSHTIVWDVISMMNDTKQRYGIGLKNELNLD